MIVWSWVGGAALAQTVTFEFDKKKAEALGFDKQELATLESDLSSLISDQLKTDAPDAYMEQFAEADAIALKGMGVDYASNPKRFVVGGTLGTGVSGIPLTFSRGDALPEGGFAFMASLHAGVNLGMIVPGEDDLFDRFLVYVNGMALQSPKNDVFAGNLYNVGVHGQVKLIGPMQVAAKLVEWGGLDFTTGYERSYYEIELTQGFPISQQVGSSVVTWDATGNYVMSATSDAVPLELSSNLRVFVATVYAGVGLDLHSARAQAEASLSGPVDSASGSTSTNIGTATVSLAGAGQATPAQPRAFVGVQLNAGPAKVYAHVNVATEERFGGFLGVRLAL